MINTIFRFVQNEAAYEAERSNIGDRTIVFCHDEGSIWKNNKKYAGGKDGIDGLPGVDGIDGGGTTKERIEKLIGDTVKVIPKEGITGTEIATIIVNGVSNTIYAPNASTSEHEDQEYETVEVQANENNNGIEIGRIKVGSNPWVVFRSPFSSINDDPDNPQPTEPTIPQEVIDKIAELDEDIDQLKSDLQDLHNQNEQGINETVQETLDEWAAFKETNGQVGSNGWEWKTDSDGNPLFFSTLGWVDSNTGTWSSIKQRINSLELSVKGIIDSGDGLYDISEALIRSWVQQNVDGTYIANALMNASYANADDDGNVLKWLVSGFKASASKYGTIAAMFSDSNEGPIAGVITKVNNNGDAIDNVQASLAAMWGDGAIAGANAVADPSKVRASLFATNADKTASAKIIVDAINDSTDSSIILDASKIDITADFINAVNSQLTVESLSAVDGSKRIDINAIDGIKQTISGTIKNQIAQDGSGLLADGNISWNTYGTVAIKGSVITGDSGVRCELVPGSDAGRVRVYDDNVSYATLSTFYGLYGTTGWLKLQKAGGGFLEAQGENISLYNFNTQLRVMIADSADDSGLISIRDANGYSCIITSTGPTTTSDMRLKDVIANKELTAKQIADAPIFTYTSKNNPDSKPIIGTSAQYWQLVLPETVSEIDNYLSLDYSRIATASVINLAKYVSNLEEEKSALTLRVEALEARLQLIENNLNS